MSFLITGVTGLIGSHLAAVIDHGGKDVVGLHHTHDPGSPLHQLVEGDIHRERVDVADAEAVSRAIAYHQPSVIIHLAAMAKVSQCRSDPRSAYRINALGTVNVLEAVRQAEFDPTVIVASTDKVYGEQEDASVDDCLDPTGPYETSKLAADAIARSYLDAFGLNIKVYRSCNVYGYDTGSRIIPNTIRACLAERDPIIFSNIEGIREYVFVGDLIDAISELIEADAGVYNVSTGHVHDQEAVVEQILDFFPNRVARYEEHPNPESEIAAQWLSQADNPPNWEAEHTFEEGIEATIDGFRKHS